MRSVLVVITTLVVISGIAQIHATVGSRTSEIGGLVCDQPEFHFGTKRDDQVVTHAFTLRNQGDQTINIKRVRASCGCTAATPSVRVISPGGTATINTRFTLSGRRGKQVKTITVESDDRLHPTLYLSLRGTIVTELAIDPSYVSLGEVHRDATTTAHATLVSLRPDVHITGIQGHSDAYRIDIDGDRRGLTISTVPPLAPGPLRAKFTVTTDHPDLLSATFNVLALAVGDLTVVPSSILLRRSHLTPSRRAVILRPTGKRSFNVLRVETPLPEMEVTSSKTPAGAIRLTFNKLDPARLEGKQIIVHTDLPTMPTVSIPFRVIP